MSSLTDILAAPAAWTLDAERSSFTFKNKGMWGLASVKGRFTEFGGEGSVDADGTVSGRVDVKAESVSTGIKQRDKHLRSADFFDAENFPDIAVTVNGAELAEQDEVAVRAEMSIRGNTVALPIRVKAELLDDGAVRLTTTTSVERNQLGVSGNLAGSIGKTTTLSADAVFRRAGG